MDLNIITFYDAYNYGAFWQAKALNLYLKKNVSKEIFFIKTNQRKFWIELTKRLKGLYRLHKLNVIEVFFYYNMYRTINKFKNEFRFKNIGNILATDIIIFGSDEIWNISRKANCKKSAEILWGKGIKDSVKRVAYAPSMNNTNEKQFAERADLVTEANKFAHISCRDYGTLDILKNTLNKSIKLVVDPTLLLDTKYYESRQIVPKEKDFILVYSYGHDISAKEIEKIIALKEQTGKQVISFGNYLKFADKNVYGSPEEFLGYFYNANCVITDTFHGTMFSMIYKKPLLLLLHRQAKVESAIKQFELEGFLVNEEVDFYQARMLKDYSVLWEKSYRMLEKYRLASYQFIKRAIDDDCIET